MPLVEYFFLLPSVELHQNERGYRQLSEDVLQQLLLPLDAIDAEGDMDVQNKRKDLIVYIQKMLNGLDNTRTSKTSDEEAENEQLKSTFREKLIMGQDFDEAQSRRLNSEGEGDGGKAGSESATRILEEIDPRDTIIYKDNKESKEDKPSGVSYYSDEDELDIRIRRGRTSPDPYIERGHRPLSPQAGETNTVGVSHSDVSHAPVIYPPPPRRHRSRSRSITRRFPHLRER